LPAATAAGYAGESIVPAGMITCSGLQAARVERDVVVDQGAEQVEHGRHGHAGRRVKLPGSCGEVPVKSISAVRSSRLTRTRHPDHRAVVEFVAELAVVQRGDHPPHRLGRVLEHVPM